MCFGYQKAEKYHNHFILEPYKIQYIEFFIELYIEFLHHQCYNFLKSRRKFGDPLDCDELNLAGDEPSPEADLVAQDERRRLYEALERLPAKQRAVITLKVEQGLSYQEISQVLGGTAGAARVNYCQALKTLKKHIQTEDDHEVAMRSSQKVAARVPRR